MTNQICLSDADLSRWLEGEVSAQQRQAFEQHVAACPSCRSRWQQVRAGAEPFERALQQAARIASASACPCDEVLNAFAERRLDVQARGVVTDHVADCPRCTEKLAETFCRDYDREGRQWWQQYV